MKKIIISFVIILILISCGVEKNIEIDKIKIEKQVNKEQIENNSIELKNNIKNNEKKVKIIKIEKDIKKGYKIESIQEYNKIKKLFGIDYEEIPLNNYLKKIDKFLIYQVCSDAYGECINYFYDTKIKKLFYTTEVLNFNSEKTDLVIGKIDILTKDKKEIKYIKNVYVNNNFNFNIRKDLKINDNIIKYFN